MKSQCISKPLQKRPLIALLAFFASFFGINDATAQSADVVNGNLLQFTDNGGWCWYQDERVIVDPANGKMLVSSLANRYGVGGTPKDGDVEVAIFDLRTGMSDRVTLKQALISYGGGDDHNAAALMLRPSGGYLAVYAGHNNNSISYYRVTDPGSDTWKTEKQFDWNSMPGGTDFETSYSNLFYLSAEDKTYNFARTDEKSPNFMLSSDEGETWSYGGQLTRPDESIGYVNGYFKYASNGVDRIDFLATEFHPRDFNTSLYHGYVKGGKTYNSTGQELDDDISDKTAPLPASFTPVIRAGTNVAGVQMTRCWNIDMQYYPDETIATVFKCRANNSDTDHRFLYGRFSGGQWDVHYMVRAGYKLFGSEEDYTGLAAVDPKDPFTVYISTPVNPATDQTTNNHEIYKGVSDDEGASWSWEAITRQSTTDNYRPVVPAWESDTTALIWYRGSMTKSQNYDGAMVGLLLDGKEQNPKTYVDASTENTKLASGSAFSPTGPSESMGASDDNWHARTGFGNGGTVFASAESGSENAPALQTEISVPQAGTYDVWVHFWANPANDWRVKAGLDSDNMQIYRSRAARQVEAGEHTESLTLSGSGDVALYQAYLGRVSLEAGNSISVFVDDEAIQTGTASTPGGAVYRSWYDGISYRNADGSTAVSSSKKEGFRLGSVLSQKGKMHLKIYSPIKSDVTLDIHDLQGNKILSSFHSRLNAGENEISWQTGSLSSGMYIIRLHSGLGSRSRLWIAP